VIDRVVSPGFLCLTAWSLAVALSRPALALPLTSPNAQCQLMPVAGELLRKLNEEMGSSKMVRLLKVPPNMTSGATVAAGRGTI
jgi:hypothetical protein